MLTHSCFTITKYTIAILPLTNQKLTAVPPSGSNTMVSSLDTLDPLTTVHMESLEHQSMSEQHSHDYEVHEPDSDTERLVSAIYFRPQNSVFKQ